VFQTEGYSTPNNVINMTLGSNKVPAFFVNDFVLLYLAQDGVFDLSSDSVGYGNVGASNAGKPKSPSELMEI